ncbi:MAG: energy transducer TonB [Bacteroidia bacterium]
MGTISNNHSMDELVFENRNKSYGAYTIRKSYEDSLIKSFSAAMLALLVLILVYHFMPDKKEVTFVPPVCAPGEWKEITFKQPLPPAQAPKHQPKPDLQSTPLFVEQVKREPIEPITQTQTPAGTGHETGPETPPPGGGTLEEHGPQLPIVELPPTPVDYADSMPEFPGGEAALMRYMQRNIRYTAYATDAHVSGKMVIRFVIDAQGNVQQIEVLKKLGYGLEEQAAEIVRKMPRWKPGKTHGHPVPVWHVQPISYQIQE